MNVWKMVCVAVVLALARAGAAWTTEAVTTEVLPEGAIAEFRLGNRGGLGLGWPTSLFSPDGSILVSGSGGELKLWDAETGRELHTLSVGAGLLGSVEFSPDGSILVSKSSPYSEIKLWDVETGELHPLSVHAGPFGLVGFSPDGSILVSISDSETKLWDVETGRELHALAVHAGLFGSVEFSPDGSILVSGSGGETKLWDVETGRELHTLAVHAGLFGSVEFSPDGETLVSWSLNEIKLWDVETGRELHTLSWHTDRITSFVFSPDGRILISVSDSEIKLWDVETGREIRTLSGHTDRITSTRFSRDGRLLITMHEHRSTTFSPDWRRIAFSKEESVVLWSVEEVLWGSSPEGSGWAAVNSDDDFLRLTGVVGSGSADDPFIITGVFRGDRRGFGLRIRNTSAHFVIREAQFASISGPGLWLENVANGWVVACVFENNEVAVQTDEQVSVTFTLNTFRNNGHHVVGGGTHIKWDDGRVGNWWEGYTGVDPDGFGIGDAPLYIAQAEVVGGGRSIGFLWWSRSWGDPPLKARYFFRRHTARETSAS